MSEAEHPFEATHQRIWEWLCTKRTCKTCKHWKPIPNLDYGDCYHGWDADDNQQTPKDALAWGEVWCHSGTFDAPMHCGPDFGCLHWEKA